ncbi:hypothetical protein, partial [uncultured Methylobacterium sp.]|uniref:hypothetical protein n=1 Tax=uncultured Methylobacterium sp. TaxID=157278 RepID=UPI0026280F94
ARSSIASPLSHSGEGDPRQDENRLRWLQRVQKSRDPVSSARDREAGEQLIRCPDDLFGNRLEARGA